MKRTLTALALVSLAGGCAKKAPATAAPAMADAAVAEDDYAESEPTRGLEYDAPASFDELQARLDELDANLSAEGIPANGESGVGLTRPETGPSPTAKKSEDGTRCERICDLKEAICDVADRICGLAEEHEGEAKYADACTRATDRCEQATNACDGCEV